MVYRLHVQVRGRALRFAVKNGETVVGSGPDCAVRVKHPSVSRRHAVVTVSEAGVWIEDLDSANGTRIDGRSIRVVTAVTPGSPLRFGSVEAVLEEVAEGDMELAVALPMADEQAKAPASVSWGPVSTIGSAVLENFCLRQLPELVELVTRSASMSEVARAIGAALIHSMPCASVEVVRGAPGQEGVLFAANREVRGEIVPVSADAGDEYELRIAFLGPAAAESYTPLVQVAAALIRMAGLRPSGPTRRLATTAAPEPPSPPSIVAAVREVYAQAARVAPSRVSVLIRGESGTGKELLARYIHAASDRCEAPLVTLNCAALPRDLLESELFGVERGVATGVEARAGKFESAHGGTLFLDEIGDMAPETQARILRVLQEGEVYRIGGHSPRPADLRVISATNRDLDAMLDEGCFRSDLYHRIADWVVELPPLRKRRPDIPNLAAHFLARACIERGVRAAGISRSAVDALMAFDWPGNVRQLEKEMARAALFLENDEILDSTRLQPLITASAQPVANRTLKDVREQAEREHIERILEQCSGEVAATAEILDIGLSTLYARMKDLGIG